MIPFDRDHVLNYLREQKHNVQLQKESQQYYILFHVLSQEFPVFIKIEPSSPLIQLILFLPIEFNPKTNGEVARLLHLLNKELDWPGFGMDETARVIFYRCVLPSINNNVSTHLLDTAMSSMPRLAQAFFPLIAAAARGAHFDTILKQLAHTLKGLR